MKKLKKTTKNIKRKMIARWRRRNMTPVVGMKFSVDQPIQWPQIDPYRPNLKGMIDEIIADI